MVILGTSYFGPLPDVVRPFILYKDKRRLDNPLDLAIQPLDRDIPRYIRQEAQNK